MDERTQEEQPRQQRQRQEQQVPKGVEVPQVQVRIGIWVKGGMEGRVVLDEKHFRRCDNSEGNHAKLKSWMFDLITAVGSVDQSLARDLKVQLKTRHKVEVIDGKFDIHFEMELGNHAKYKGELCALIVGQTSGEAKGVVRGISEKGVDA